MSEHAFFDGNSRLMFCNLKAIHLGCFKFANYRFDMCNRNADTFFVALQGSASKTSRSATTFEADNRGVPVSSLKFPVERPP